MRNYYKALRIPTSASPKTIKEALNTDGVTAEKAANALNKPHRADALDILCNEQRCRLYTRTVELYQCLHEASACLDFRPGVDSHLWHERLANFDDGDQSADLL